jgi:SAM-dependent methyltransferase
MAARDRSRRARASQICYVPPRMEDTPIERLARAIETAVRAQAAPPPRGVAFLALDHASGTALELLASLAAHGIFRKYERVLDLGTGLGAVARWMAARLGCDVLAVAADPGSARAATSLTRRARLGAQVRTVAAALDAVPVRGGYFTHVWAVESLGEAGDPAAVLAEALRALRPGGTLAVQELVPAGNATLAIAGRRLRSIEAWTAAVRAAGFGDVTVRDRTADARERSARLVAARTQLEERLAAGNDGAVVRLVAARTALATALAHGRLGVAQLVATRP